MKKNIGRVDRITRIVIGIIACFAVFFVPSTGIKVALGLLGIFSIGEALISRCVLYALLGRNTCPVEDIIQHNSKI